MRQQGAGSINSQRLFVDLANTQSGPETAYLQCTMSMEALKKTKWFLLNT